LISDKRRRVLTDTFYGSVSPDPAISPDGRLIAYSEAVPSSSVIWILNRATGDTRAFPAGPDASQPDFSPDGTQLLYVSPVDGVSQIFVSDLNGSQQRQLTFDSRPHAHPKFSPDGRYVAYTSYSNPEFSPPERLVIRNVTTGATTEIAPPGFDLNLTEWGREKVFQFVRYARRNHKVVIRTFNPGTIRVRGRGIRNVAKVVASPGRVALRIGWTGRRKRSRVRIDFKPVGSITSSRKVTIRR
jgi:dipeptidyl aminopeptidase/acylaminoacyl peptidase